MENKQERNSCCCSCETDDASLKKRIGEIAYEYRGKEGSLIQVLHIAQEIYGHLPQEIQLIVAENLNVPLTEVSSVVSFYSFFATKPRGKHMIRVCMGTACYVRGGKRIVDRLEELLNVGIGQTTEDRIFTFEVARCIGACGLAPAVAIDGEVYKTVNPDNLESILAPYYQGVPING